MPANNWDLVLDQIKKNNFNLHVWIEHSKGELNNEGSTLTLEVPEQFQRDTLVNKYKDDLDTALREAFGQDIQYSVTVNPQLNGKAKHVKTDGKITVEKQIDLFSPEANRPEPPRLNTRLRFDNFLVGNGNKFAHAASLAVADAPGQSAYNPLYIYGGVGLGKTHLLHAIGNQIYLKNPETKIIIVTAESFLNEFVRRLQAGKTEEFKDKYRNIDVLLIDDIQFLERGEYAREEFFHTFNELSSLNKQIVTTSDSRPQQLKQVEDRLKSRLSAGLVVDLQPPDFELRVAIARSFAREISVRVPENIIAEIADKIENNIRDLQGTLKTIKIMSEQNKCEVTMEIAKEAIRLKIPEIAEEKKISVDQIQKVVADYFNLKIQDLSSKKRPENIAKARQIAMFITRNLTEYSLVQIGQYFGGKDHTTVMHAIEKIEGLINEDEKFKAMVNDLVNKITKR